MENEIIAKKLQAPFDPSDIEWKPQTSGISAGGKAYVLAVPYITNRAIQKRLDDVFGVFGWENSYQPAPDGKGFLCGITIHSNGQSVTKWDGSENTKIEPLKGGLSGSMKRAAVQLGIGRYLYELPEFWAEAKTCGKESNHVYGNVIRNKGKDNIAWKNPTLPSWARPSVDIDKHNTAIADAENIPALKECFKEAWRAAKVNQNEGAQRAFKQLYDARLAHFEKVAAESVVRDTKAIEEWIESRRLDIEMVPHLSSCETVYKRLQETLEEKCKDTFVDQESLQKRLHEIYQNHIKTLQEGEAA